MRSCLVLLCVGAAVGLDVGDPCAGTGVTADSIKDACITTTALSCSTACKDDMKKIKNSGTCVNQLLTTGRKYGFSDKIMCSWLAPCDIQEMQGK